MFFVYRVVVAVTNSINKANASWSSKPRHHIHYGQIWLWCSSAYLIREPNEPGLLVVTEHPVLGVQQFPHDEEEELFPYASRVDCLLSHEDDLPRAAEQKHQRHIDVIPVH